MTIEDIREIEKDIAEHEFILRTLKEKIADTADCQVKRALQEMIASAEKTIKPLNKFYRNYINSN